eukprot:sb/3476014/
MAYCLQNICGQIVSSNVPQTVHVNLPPASSSQLSKQDYLEYGSILDRGLDFENTLLNLVVVSAVLVFVLITYIVVSARGSAAYTNRYEHAVGPRFTGTLGGRVFPGKSGFPVYRGPTVQIE